MKLVYILPHYSKNADNNYYSQLEMIGQLEKLGVNVFIFAESASGNTLNHHKLYIQKFKFLPIRLLERFIIFTKLKMTGYTHFYAHYADTSSIIASIVTRIFGGQTSKWHCAAEHNFQKSWQPKHLMEKLTRELPLWLAFKFVNTVITCTPAMRRYYSELKFKNISNIKIIPNAINLQRFTPATQSKTTLKKQLNLPSTKPILLFVHWLSPRKGADRIKDYLDKIISQNSHLHLVVIGQGPLEKDLINLSKSYSNHLSFLGPVANRDIPKYYQAADFLLMPSKIEEFGRVQIEAMACGLPILSTKTASTNQVLNPIQAKYALNQSDYLKLIDKADYLLDHKSEYQALVDTGFERVKSHYSLTNVAKEFIEAIS